eukprot:g7537.t1
MASVVQKANSNSIAILSWNILAQCYFLPKKKLNFQLSYQHLDINSPIADWQHRKTLILKKLLEKGKDIICLQEVEFTAFKEDLLPFLSAHGFQGSIQKIKNTRHPQGVATFWRSELFQNVAEFSKNRTLTTILKDHQSRLLAVINCHLEGHPSKAGERAKQLCSSMYHLHNNFEHHGVIVAGDFNCQNGASAASAYLSLGHIPLLDVDVDYCAKKDKSPPHPNGLLLEALPKSTNNLPLHIISIKNDYCQVNENQWIHSSRMQVPFHEWNSTIDVKKLGKIIPHPYTKCNFKSVYPPVNHEMLAQGIYSIGEEFTFCTRPGHAIDGLDQIWYTNSSLMLEGMDKLYSSEDVRAQILSQGLPHEVNPSDHIPIGATFSWNKGLENLQSSLVAQGMQNGGSNLNSPTVEELLEEANELYENCPLAIDVKAEFLQIVMQLVETSKKGRRISKEEIEINKALSARKKLILSSTTTEGREMLNRFVTLRKKASKKALQQPEEEHSAKSTNE